MTRKLIVVLAAVFAIGVFAAGCGDDDKGDSGSSGGGTTTQAADTSGGGGTETNASDTSGGGGTDVPDSVKAAVEQCKQTIAAVPTLKDDTKKDLQDICEKAASGDEQAVKDATREVCEKIVKDTVPAGAAQDQAKEACKTGTT